jgi:hypothetical protein
MTLQKTRTAAVFALAAMVLAVVATAGSAGAQEFQQQPQTQPNNATSSAGNATVPQAASGSALDAQQIYETGSISTDSDVKALVISIPDNVGTERAIWEGFLPSNASVATGTNVVVLNTDVNVTHRVSMSGEGVNQSETEALPYQNSSAFLLNETGEYTFTEEEAQLSGTVNVVENDTTEDDPITDETRPTVGLFVVPSNEKNRFEAQLSDLGFNAVSSFDFSRADDESAAAADSSDNASASTDDGTTTSAGNTTDAGSSGEMTLFVWTQEVSHPNTLDGRLASKVRALEDALYPADAIKQSTAVPAG